MSASISRRLFAAGLGAAPLLRPAQSKPNIVLILTDDHSVPFLGCYGDPVLRTPNLDRFASEGMRCDRMFTAAPQCVPSRAAFLTGRSPVANRIARFSSPLPPENPTLPELLRPAGYFTGACRRWYHLDGPARPGAVSGPIMEKHGLRTFHKRVDFLDATSQREKTPEIVNQFFDKAPAGKPYFLWVNFNDPHHQWDANAVSPPYDPAKIPVPPYLPDLPGVRADLARFYGEVARADEEFQWVLDVIRKRGRDENTIIAFLGDNGMAFPHGKGSLYDPGLNVPCLFRWPGVIQSGASTRELMSGEDLTPTFLEAAGVRQPEWMSGRSMLPLLRGQGGRRRDNIFGARLAHGNSAVRENTRASEWDQSRCLRTDRYKLIYNCTRFMEYAPVDSSNDPGWKQMVAAHQAGTLPAKFSRAYFTHPRPVLELYDLEKDPVEFNNLAAEKQYEPLMREMMIAMQEKMILDYDFLPLPLSE